MIEIKPVYFERGKTKVAVYFLGHIREVKLSSLLAQKKIKFKAVDEECFTILCLCQKREKSIVKKDSFPKLEIHLHDFPQIFDLVLWGGEAEPGLDFEKNSDKKVYTPGNACIHDFNKFDVLKKTVGLLTIKKKEIKLETIPLQSSRPFIYRQITSGFLEECLRKNPSSKTLTNILEKEILYLVQEFYQNSKTMLRQVRKTTLKSS